MEINRELYFVKVWFDFYIPAFKKKKNLSRKWNFTWSYKTKEDTKLGGLQIDGAERSGDGSDYINSYTLYRIL